VVWKTNWRSVACCSHSDRTTQAALHYNYCCLVLQYVYNSSSVANARSVGLRQGQVSCS
jgi:hypothetical protein